MRNEPEGCKSRLHWILPHSKDSTICPKITSKNASDRENSLLPDDLMREQRWSHVEQSWVNRVSPCGLTTPRTLDYRSCKAVRCVLTPRVGAEQVGILCAEHLENEQKRLHSATHNVPPCILAVHDFVRASAKRWVSRGSIMDEGSCDLKIDLCRLRPEVILLFTPPKGVGWSSREAAGVPIRTPPVSHT